MKIFCDFDGTVAKNDVGNLLFRRFAGDGCFEIVQKWKQGEISSKECLMQECRLARVTEKELHAFADGQELDPYFVEFVRFCESRDIEIEIVSDGLDFYIEKILNNFGLGGLNFHSNSIIFVGEDTIKPGFPYFDKSCGKCANCKGYHVRRARGEHSTLVYVGDGLSDRCGAEEADLVFARQGRDLLQYCRDNNITHYEFGDFSDVLQQLKPLINNH